MLPPALGICTRPLTVLAKKMLNAYTICPQLHLVLSKKTKTFASTDNQEITLMVRFYKHGLKFLKI